MSAHENATPRPWKVIRFGEDPAWDDGCCDVVWDEKEAVQLRAATGVTEADAALIVEAVNAYETLRTENERLRAAATSVLAERRGADLVTHGIRDNGAVRRALTELEAALSPESAS